MDYDKLDFYTFNKVRIILIENILFYNYLLSLGKKDKRKKNEKNHRRAN